MRRPVAIASLVLAWLCANGAVWDAVQVVAWGRMFTGYAGSMSLSAALRETFDASKPCKLCCTVAKAKRAAQTQLPAASERDMAKIVLALETADVPVFASEPGAWRAIATHRPQEWTEAVPVPPPRV